MQKLQIVSPIYFDGVLFPAGTVIDPSLIALNAESLIERSWAIPYEGDREAVASLDILRDAMPKPVPEPDPQPAPKPEPAPMPAIAPMVESIPEPVVVPPLPAEHAKRKRKS